MSESMNTSRLLWACRRGMKELDVLLQPFAQHCYENLDVKDQQTFEYLLSFEDPTLFAWFMREETCQDTTLNAMIERIREQRYS